MAGLENGSMIVHSHHRLAISACSLTVLAVVLSLGGCGREVELHMYDRDAVAALADYQATYELDGDGRVVELRLDGEHVDDAALAALTDLVELRSLSLYGSSVTDAGLKHLEGLGRLESLGLGKTKITDRGLARVSRLPNLKWLWLGENNKVTKRGIASLKKARPELEIYE